MDGRTPPLDAHPDTYGHLRRGTPRPAQPAAGIPELAATPTRPAVARPANSHGYRETSHGTASNQQVLLLLLERLVVDVNSGYRAILATDRQTAHDTLTHAQSIVSALQTMLNPDGFTGGHELMALYDYIFERLIAANVTQDPTIASEARGLCEQLEDTWRTAASLAETSLR